MANANFSFVLQSYTAQGISSCSIVHINSVFVHICPQKRHDTQLRNINVQFYRIFLTGTCTFVE